MEEETFEVPKKTIGFVYDDRMQRHKLEGKPHPECPERVSRIVQNLQKQGIWDKLDVISKVEPAKKDIIALTHRESYVELVQEMWPEECNRSNMVLNGCYYNQHTGESAFLSAGAVITAVDNVMSGKWNSAFVSSRPPGHHSGAGQQCSGFCFFNNVVISANYLKSKYGLKKIVIFDFDVHHGDGTQALTYEDQEILFISMHQYDEGKFYPQKTGDCKKTGNGYNVNIGWNTNTLETAGDDEYIYAMEGIALPIIRQFKPEFVVVSAGFDSACNDQLGRCQLTENGFKYICSRLRNCAEKSVFVLEGGYNLESIEWASYGAIEGIISPLDEMKCEEICEGLLVNRVGMQAVEAARLEQRQYWELNEGYMKRIQQRNELIGTWTVSQIQQVYQDQKGKCYKILTERERQWVNEEAVGERGLNDSVSWFCRSGEIKNTVQNAIEIKVLSEEEYAISGMVLKNGQLISRHLELHNSQQQELFKPQIFKEFVKDCNANDNSLEIVMNNTYSQSIDQLGKSLDKLSELFLPVGSLIILNGKYLNALVSKISDSDKSISLCRLMKTIKSFIQELSSLVLSQENR